MPGFDDIKILMNELVEGLRGSVPGDGLGPYYLLYESEDNNASPAVQHRIYLRTGGGYNGVPVYTYNARWEGNENLTWARDVAVDSTKITMPNSSAPNQSVIMERRASGAADNWIDSAWTKSSTLGHDANGAFLELVGGPALGTAPLDDAAYGVSLVKAWGIIDCLASPDVVQGFNIASTATYNGDFLRVTLSNDLNGSNTICPVVTFDQSAIVSGSRLDIYPEAYIISGGQIDVVARSGGGTSTTALASTTVRVFLQVMGLS